MLQPPSSARSQHSPDKTPTEDEIEVLCRNVKQCLSQEGHACGRAARRLSSGGASSSSCKTTRKRHNAEARSEQDDGAGSNTTCSKAFSATLRANAGGVKRLDVVKAVNARQVSTEHLSATPPVAVTTLPSVVPHNSEGKSLLTNWQELNTQKLGSCSGSSTVMTQVDKHTIGTLPKMTRREKTHRTSVRVNSPRTVRPGYAPMFKSKDTASNRSTVKAALQGRPTAEALPQGKPTAEAALQGRPMAEAALQGRPTAEAALQGRPMAEAALQGRPMAEAAPQSKPRAEAALQGRPMAEVPLHGKPTHEARLRVAPVVTIPLPVHPITAGPLLAWPVAGETAMSVQGAGEPNDSLEAFMTAEMLSEDSILTEKQLEGNISTRREKSAPAIGSARTDIDIQKQYSSVQESNVKKVPVIPHPPSSHRHSNSPARQRYGNPRHRRIVSGHSTTAQQKHQAT
ncbi:PREDICTED: uncharacterized protein LOC106813537 isoform X2 [Priapulus caudatus]|uniref:Uncharacterized protein LOC106813537 isoform X2 n=1 Tax=Priapulus caudatus TaxID=37621 RepID=A0ABM1ELX2_PRICU|nr:PREDICTED: uncharacterized protein LOC106813537 isoform X2 [Priapulus caudatus]